MKATEPQVVRALDKPDGSWRLVLLYGPDDGGSQTLAARFATTMGNDADRIDLEGATLKNDPARLSDEATAITMFGGPRWIRVTGGEEVIQAVQALFEAPHGCPVLILAGQLKPSSALLKLAIARPDVIAFASAKPEGKRAEDIAIETGRTFGARLSNDAARMLADATAGDRTLMQREIEKLALYVDAAPDRPRPVERSDIEAVGAALDIRASWDLVDAVFDGKPVDAAREMMGEAAIGAIPALRAASRRALLLARLAAARRGGAGPRIFDSREREGAERQVRLWSPPALVTAHHRAMAAEAALKQTGAAGEVLAEQMLLGLARAGERRR